VTAPNRPAGSTPRGLPYPGSANIHAETPAAIRALAEALEAQLGTAVGGLVNDTYVGVVAIGSGGLLNENTIRFPRLATIRGGLVQQGIAGGTPQRIAFATGIAGQPGNTAKGVYLRNGNDYNGYPTGSVTITAIAWGTPA
jgi:hypothetical protein